MTFVVLDSIDLMSIAVFLTFIDCFITCVISALNVHGLL